MAATAAKPKMDMTKGKIIPQLVLFAIPVIATAVLQMLFNTADTIVVGRWGGDTPEACERALSAVGSCGALINLLISLFNGMASGAGVSVAHAIGAKEYEKIEKIVHTAIITATVCGIVVSIVGIAFSKPLLVLMGTEASVLDQAALYMKAYFCGIPAHMLYSYCAAMLRSTGDTTRPLFFLTTAGVVNVLLNLVMVLVFHMGAVGVGIATAVAHWISCVMIIVHMHRTKDHCRFEPKKLKIHGPTLKKIIAIGLPTGIQGSLFSISNVLIQTSINSFDSTAVISGNVVGTNISNYTALVTNGFSQAALTFVGQNVGAKNIRRIKKGVVYSLAIIVVLGLALGSLTYLAGEFLCGIFSPDNEAVIEVAMIKLLYMGMFMFLNGTMDVGSNILRAMGKSITSMTICLIGVCAVRILWIYTIFAYFHTIESLYISYPITWGLSSLVLAVCIFFEAKKLAQLWKREKEEESAQKAEEAAV